MPKKAIPDGPTARWFPVSSLISFTGHSLFSWVKLQPRYSRVSHSHFPSLPTEAGDSGLWVSFVFSLWKPVGICRSLANPLSLTMLPQCFELINWDFLIYVFTYSFYLCEYVCVCSCVCMYTLAHMPQCCMEAREQFVEFTLFTIGVPGIKLGSSDLLARAFAHWSIFLASHWVTLIHPLPLRQFKEWGWLKLQHMLIQKDESSRFHVDPLGHQFSTCGSQPPGKHRFPMVSGTEIPLKRKITVMK